MTQVHDFRSASSLTGPIMLGELSKPVFFVGFMGAGKTSVARKLARLASVVAIDMDTLIDRRCDKKASELITECGETYFREVETSVLYELALGEPHLVSCGGGVVLAARNRALLRDHGYVVYLQVTAAEAASRISNMATRPLFGDLVHAQEVLESRMPLYEEVADLTLDTTGRGTGSVAREAFYQLKRLGVLRMRE